jgi:hypothetical protein
MTFQLPIDETECKKLYPDSESAKRCTICASLPVNKNRPRGCLACHHFQKVHHANGQHICPSPQPCLDQPQQECPTNWKQKHKQVPKKSPFNRSPDPSMRSQQIEERITLLQQKKDTIERNQKERAAAQKISLEVSESEDERPQKKPRMEPPPNPSISDLSPYRFTALGPIDEEIKATRTYLQTLQQV